jgi:hypothetical protein
MSQAPSLIVPSQYARGKPNRRPVVNEYARVVRGRKDPRNTRYRGPVWKGAGKNGGMLEHPGRKYGQVPGSWIDDLTQLRKVIILCDTPCQSKFYYKRAQYYRDERYGSRATATCDGCRKHTTRGRLYLPEERLTDPSGMSRPGQCWSPA